MKLRDLEAYFIRYETKIETKRRIIGPQETWVERGRPTESYVGPTEYMVHADSLADAQGIFMMCPKCAKVEIETEKHGHWMQVTFAGRGVEDSQGCHGSKGEPIRWNVTGTGLDDLTTTPSIQLIGGCNWHGYITNGDAS